MNNTIKIKPVHVLFFSKLKVKPICIFTFPVVFLLMGLSAAVVHFVWVFVLLAATYSRLAVAAWGRLLLAILFPT